MQRFWAKVKKTETCWLWEGYKNPSGYGRFNAGKGKMMLVHRYSFEQAYGEIPKGTVIDHICRKRNCVNPDHLRAVTDMENITASGSLANAAKIYCPKCGGDYLWRKCNEPHRFCPTCSPGRNGARQ